MHKRLTAGIPLIFLVVTFVTAGCASNKSARAATSILTTTSALDTTTVAPVTVPAVTVPAVTVAPVTVAPVTVAPVTAPPTTQVTVNNVHGTVSLMDDYHVVIGIVTGNPQTASDMETPQQLTQESAILNSLAQGKTYPCPLGAGGGFSDIVPGGQVVGADGSGAILSTGQLSGGVFSSLGCTFNYTLQVQQASFYQITVTHRGALTYSLAQMQANGWKVASVIQ